MRTAIKIYGVTCTQAQMMCETGFRYSLTPWSGNTRCYTGCDDGGKMYLLPEGYHVIKFEDWCGQVLPFVFEPNAETETIQGSCALCVGKNDLPVLRTLCHGYVYLRELKEEELCVEN